MENGPRATSPSYSPPDNGRPTGDQLTPLEIVLDRLGAKGPVRRCGKSWSAQCPGHDDRSPSLSVAEGDDGRVLLYCHAGCSQDRVVDRLGLTFADLYPYPLPMRMPNGVGPIQAAYRYGANSQSYFCLLYTSPSPRDS